MERLSRLGFFRYAQVGQVALVGDTFYVSPTLGAQAPEMAIGAIDEQISSFAKQAAQITSLERDLPSLSAARRIAANENIFRFCLTDLRVHLQCLSRGEPVCSRPKSDVNEMFDRLSRNIAEFDASLSRFDTASRIAHELRRQLSPPCMIDTNGVVPLRRLTEPTGDDNCLRIGGSYYMRDDAHVKSFETLEGAVRKSILKGRDPDWESNQKHIATMADAVVDAATNLLLSYPSEPADGFRTIFADDQHQLQHDAQGNFVLVRGPVQHRLNDMKLLVALNILGKSRRQMLAVSPIMASRPSDVWRPHAGGFSRSICMGSARQYAHLLSDRLTDSEAIIEYLDAGVIVATNRPEYHAIVRGETTSRPVQASVRTISRRRRRP